MSQERGGNSNVDVISSLFAKRLYKQALEYIDTIPQTTDDNNTPLILWRARLLSAVKSWKESIYEWRKVLLVHPKHGEALLKLGRAQFELKEFDESIATLANCLTRPACWEHAALLTARCLTETRKYDRAITLWKTLAERRLRSPEAEQQWLRCSIAAMRFDEASLALKNAADHHIDLSGLEYEAASAIWKASLKNQILVREAITKARFTSEDATKLLTSILAYREDDLLSGDAIFPDDANVSLRLLEFGRWCRLRCMVRMSTRCNEAMLEAISLMEMKKLSVNYLVDILVNFSCMRNHLDAHLADSPFDWSAFRALGERLASVLDRLVISNFPELSLLIWSEIDAPANTSPDLARAIAHSFSAVGEFDRAAAVLEGVTGDVATGESTRLHVTVLCSSRRFSEALAVIDKMSAKCTRNDETAYDLLRCQVYLAQRNWRELREMSRRIVHGKGATKEAYVHLGASNVNLLNFREAKDAYIAALELDQSDSSILIHIGTVCRMLGEHDEALDYYRGAFKRGVNNLALLTISGEFIAARSGFEVEEILSTIEQSSAGDQCRILMKSCILLSAGRARKVIELALSDREALARDPYLSCVVARALKSENEHEQALVVLERHIASRECVLDVTVEYFDALIFLGRVTEAKMIVSRLPQMTSTPRSRLRTSMRRMDMHLNLGDFRSAWRCYDDLPFVDVARHYGVGRPFRAASDGRGSELSEPFTLVLATQGAGDEIRLASLYSEIRTKVPSSVFACDPRLLSLFRRSFPDCKFHPCIRRDQKLISPETVGLYNGLPDLELSKILDMQTFELMSKARESFLASDFLEVLRPGRESFDSRSTYLTADPAILRAAVVRLGSISDKRKVGIVWQSENLAASRSMHYSSPDTWDEIFSLPGIDFISMQHGDCEPQIVAVEERFGIRIHRLADVDLRNDFESVAGVLCGLDAVVGPVVTCTELCAALGTPVVFMWRVPSGRWRKLPSEGGDIWHSSGVPVFGSSPADYRGLIKEAARSLERQLAASRRLSNA